MADEDTRLQVQHIATSMYSARIEEDGLAGRAHMYRTNPDARALYFKGAHDVLACIEEWAKLRLPPNTFGMFLEELGKQTTDTGPVN